MAFSNADLLPRRLSPAGCRLATAQLRVRVEQLEADGALLPEPVREAVAAVTKAGEELSADHDEATMLEVDRGADACVAALSVAIDAAVRAGVASEVLPLTDPEQQLRRAAKALKLVLFPEGTAFLVKPYRQQYEALLRLSERLAESETHRQLQLLGLDVHAGRVRRWTELYGQRLGVTAPRPETDPVQRIQRWHDAWGDLVVAVRGSFRDDKNASHEEARRALLGPYDEQAAAERVGDATQSH